ncbi:MAG: hypothetical protein BWZ07_00711 [Alphaproteobacteria bacterium ADurb.BinA280]|nr:MAG: hypothetical protein BWZ07_00711 [Alphaproteobacteria bacterium ADurb.BinA280]
MTHASLLLLDDADFAPEHYMPPVEKILHGQPSQTVWMHYSDPTGQFHVGVWRGEIGKWHIRYTEEEWCELLAGESVVIPRGFVGTWEVLQPTTKRFVIYERSDASEKG